MISAYVFSGPSLPSFMIKEKLGYELNEDNEITLNTGDKIKFLPPVSEGDILRIIPQKPKIVGIIDGYFENIPSVWHKEILYAMTQGIHILGAASMGALRAAELAAFGMEGIGSIYHAFSDGFLEDDDEVTVAHGPEELGFPLLSEAMVNIRRTLDDAHHQNILSASNREMLLSIAKELHYKSRNYGKILALAQDRGMGESLLEEFQGWLQRGGRQDQKFLDAAALVTTIIDKITKGVEPKRVLYNFENTTIWKRSRTQIGETVT